MSFAPTKAEPSATATRTKSIATIDSAALESDLFLANFWRISLSSAPTLTEDRDPFKGARSRCCVERPAHHELLLRMKKQDIGVSLGLLNQQCVRYRHLPRNSRLV